MKLVTYNIQYSLGRDGVYDLARIIDAVRGADVIALQEVTRNFTQCPDADQPERIAELLPDFHWIYNPYVDLDASVCDTDGRVTNKRLQSGNMLLARWPILSCRLFLLPRERAGDIPSNQMGALEGVVDYPGGPLRVYSVHLNGLSTGERMAQIDFLLRKLPEVPREGGTLTGSASEWNHEKVRAVPVPEDFVVLGDFNLTPDSPEYSRIVGSQDGTRSVVKHLVDLWVQTGHRRDEGVTANGDFDDDENFQPCRLDYGFVTTGLAGNVTNAWIDSEAIGSDHQPVWFEMAL